MVRSSDIKRALVLPGGGSSGAYQVGAAEVLMGPGGRVYDAYLGVSVGAVNAAHFAMYKTGEEAKACIELRDLWLGLDDSKVAPKRFLYPICLAWASSLRNTEPLRKLLAERYDAERVRASGKQLRVVAVDLVAGQASVRRAPANPAPGSPYEGERMVDWILGSAAAPIFYPPVTFDGLPSGREDLVLVDGGVMDVAPVREAIDLGATSIDVLLPMSSKVPGWNGKNRVWDTAPRVLELMVREIIEGDLRQVELHNELIRAGRGRPGKCEVHIEVIRPVEPLPIDSTSFDPAGIRRCMEQGRIDALNHIANASALGGVHLGGPYREVKA